MPLSVLSALSRLDLDPHDEAARLSDLADDAAAAQQARTIARQAVDLGDVEHWGPARCTAARCDRHRQKPPGDRQ